MNKLMLSLLFALLFCFSNSWTSDSSFQQRQEEKKDTFPNLDFCSGDQLMQKALERDPLLQLAQHNWERDVQQHLIQGLNSRALHTLPVVVHIIHNNGSENVSDAMILQGIQHLNDAYANEGDYDPSTGTDTQLAFCLAQRDPQGNATNGITRTVSTLTDMDANTQDLSVKNLIRWDPLSYINIWLVREICRGGSGCGVAGYAYLPSAHGQDIDGIVMEARFFGSSPGNSAVQVHEMGHYLGLYHTFQGGCTNNNCLQDGDRVCDTPPDQSTARVPCNGVANSCSTDVNLADPNNPFLTDQNDMFINYMDYGDFNCYSAFTPGQASRMIATVETTRQSLLASKACLDPCLNPIAAAFSTANSPVDIGTTVNFNNSTTNATNYEWQINGTPFSSATNPSYTFNTEGTFRITLLANNNDPNCSDSISVLINVICPVNASFSTAVVTVGLGEPVDFLNTSSNATSYEWTVGGVPVGTSTNLNYTFLNTGIQEVCLKASSGLCEDMFCTLIAVTVGSDDCESTFFKVFGEEGIDELGGCLFPAEDGNIYIGGNKGGECLLAKMTPQGELLWQRSFDPTASPDQILDLRLDSDNNILMCGYGHGNTSGAGPYFQGFVIKYDPVANQVLWTTREQNNVGSRFHRIIEQQAGGDYLLLGYYFPIGTGGRGCDSQMAILNRSNGQVIGNDFSYHMGSCEGFWDAEIINNSIYTVGRYNFWGGGQSRMRGGLSRFDMNGNHEFTRLHLTNVNTSAYLHTSDMLVEGNQMMLLYFGNHDGGTTNSWFHLSRTNLDGTIVWAKHYQLPGTNRLRASQVTAVPGGYVILGYDLQSNKILLFKTDTNGNVSWAKQYGGSADLLMQHPMIAQEMLIKDIYLYILAYTPSFGGSDNDLAVLKMDLDGNVEGDCPYVADITLNVTDYNNPYDGLHDLDRFPGPLQYTQVVTSPTDVALDLEDVCAKVCLEICDNGIDDDDDGLIDYFDETDCPCTPITCNGPTFQACTDCELPVLPANGWEVQTIWQTSVDFGNSILTPVVGDIDGDCEPDVVVASREKNRLYVLNGKNGQVKYEIPTYQTTAGVTGNLAIADVDRNGWGDIFIITNDDAPNQPNESFRLVRYEFDGSSLSERFISDEPIGPYTRFDEFFGRRYSNMSIILGDINSDGVPEVVVGNQVFNAVNGDLLARGGADNSVGSQQSYISNNGVGHINSFAVLADVLPDEHCALCGGLELVAGNMVYSIFIPPGGGVGSGIMQVEVDMSAVMDDGFVSVADLDFDGHLDVVSGQGNNVAHSYSVQAWSPRQAVMYDRIIIAEPRAIGLGRMAIANIDDDPSNLEVAFHVGSRAAVYSFDPTSRTFSFHQQATVNDLSLTGLSVFDFNGDGQNEIAYRDEDFLHIFNGNDMSELVNPIYSCNSRTSNEYPVIADVNGDGQTEILVACGNELTLIGNAEVGKFWMPSRKVWNQNAYFYTNINDDLTIPAHQQAHHRVGDRIILNSFLKQHFSPRPPAPDATLAINSDSTACQGDSIRLWLTICNIGDNLLNEATPIAFYAGDPTTVAAPALAVIPLGQTLEPDSCLERYFTIPITLNIPIFAVANDNASLTGPYVLSTDFPVTSIPECDYTNNMDSTAALTGSASILDLGPDIIVCDNGVFTFDAGADFDSYLWQDGSIQQTYTAWEPGTYWVEVNGGCAGIQRDTVSILIDSLTVIDLGTDVIVCEGDTLNLAVSGFDTYQWFPAATLSCTDCASVAVSPTVTTTYTVVGSTLNGCISTDTIRIVIQSGDTTQIDSTICLGEVLVYNGISIDSDTMLQVMFQNQWGCDSVIFLNVALSTILDTSITIDTSACPGDFVTFNGVNIPAGGSEIFGLTNADGCDSIVTVNVLSLDTFLFTSSLSICPGDSALIFGVYEQDAGWYQQALSTADGCDSIYQVQLTHYTIPPIDLGPDTIICEGEVLSLTLSGFDTYQWTPAATLNCDNCSTVLATPDTTITYIVQGFTTDGCVNSDTIRVVVAMRDSTSIDTLICQDEILIYNGATIDSDTMLQFILQNQEGCDSIVLLNVTQNSIVGTSTTIDTSACPGDFVIYNGVNIPAGGSEIFGLTNADGCDSIVTVNVMPLDTFLFSSSLSICLGDSALIFGVYEQDAGWYREAFSTADGCDSIYQVQLTHYIIPPIDLGPDTIICEGEALSLTLSGFDTYQWSPAATLNCDNCSTVLATPDTTITYVVQGFTTDGCVNSDTIRVLVEMGSSISIDTLICQNEALVYNGISINSDTMLQFIFQNQWGCDSVIVLNVTEDTLNANVMIDTMACLGSFVNYNGINIPAGASEVFGFTNANGCDSTVTVNVLPLDTFSFFFTEFICPGDSALIFGVYESAVGLYEQSFLTADGCDSVYQVELFYYEAPQLSANIIGTCPDELSGAISVTASGGNPPYQYNWSIASDSSSVFGLAAGTYDLTVVDARGCEEQLTAVVPVAPLPEFDVEISDISCFGEGDGSLIITASQADAEIRIDTFSFIGTAVLSGLSEGSYEVMITDGIGCNYTEIYQIAEPPPLVLSLPDDTTIEVGDTFLIRPTHNSTDSLLYTWAPDVEINCLTCSEVSVFPSHTTLYSVTIENEQGCLAADSIWIAVDRTRRVYIPNVFTPNSDGFNDGLTVYGNDKLASVVYFRVYDRWGELVFEKRNFLPNVESLGWDGTFKGQLMDNAVFVYVTEVEFLDGFRQQYSGDITLLR